MQIKEGCGKLGLTEKELRGIVQDLKLPIGARAKTLTAAQFEQIQNYLGTPHIEETSFVEDVIQAEKNKVVEGISLEEEKIMRELEEEELKKQKIKSRRKKALVPEETPTEKVNLEKSKATEIETTIGEEHKITCGEQDRTITIPEVISIKELAEKIVVSAPSIIEKLIKNGIFVTINHKIDFETASLIADEFKIKLKQEIKTISSEDLLSGNLENLLKQDNPEDQVIRPPIVTIMGHVDHGKTKLLDFIRKTNVVDLEAGGITQHIGAYQAEHKGRKITFLDTPGHEAFTAMRARGARVTDLVILVVAADESVKPQTEEAISHTKEAGVPLIVAINKVDKPEANIEKVKGDLAKFDLIPEDWGGKTIMVPVSALTGKGMDGLLETILLVADLANLKADPKRPAIGTVIEAVLDKNLGPVATVLINSGTLKIGDHVVVGEIYGKIKSLKDHTLKNIKQAGPSTPVRVAGLSETPQAGDILQVVPEEKTAKAKALEIKELRKAKKLRTGGMDMEEIINLIKQGQMKQLKIVLKADTKGSLEAIRQSLAKIKSEEVGVRIIHSGVGNITETDVLMASASRGLVIGFDVVTTPQVDRLSERESTEIRIYRIIYKLIEEIQAILTGMLSPEIKEVDLGEGEVLKLFYFKKKEYTIGVRVNSGRTENKAKFQIMQNSVVVGEGSVLSLQKQTTVVKEVKEGEECGLKCESSVKINEGDKLRFYKIEKKQKKL